MPPMRPRRRLLLLLTATALVGLGASAAPAAPGQAFVYDARSGTPLASYQLASGASFVNDVVVTRTAAWFTDSLSPVLYRVPLGRHGELPSQQEVTTLPLSGDFQQQPGFNANGI